MDSLSELVELIDPPNIKYNEQVDGFEASEIVSHGDSVSLQNRRVSNNEVVPWLKGEGIHGSNDAHNDEICRMVWVRRKSKPSMDLFEDEISKKNFDLLLEDFELKKTYPLLADGAIVCVPVRDQNDRCHKQCFALGISGRNGVLIWAHDLTTNRTKAVWCGGHQFIPFSLVRPVLEQQKHLARHPMFMALVAVICVALSIGVQIEPVCNKINQAENRTQHCPESLRAQPSTAAGYTSLSALMSESALRLASLQKRSQLAHDLFDSILGYRWPDGVERPEGADRVVREINEQVLILKKRLVGQDRRIHFLSQRANIQLTAVSSVFFSFCLQTTMMRQNFPTKRSHSLTHSWTDHRDTLIISSST